ncbi:type II toxin-antitoxin system PemK/MazF family toxin [Vibrio europaeus]|uniref:Type II toxin-antitoxin system PemK/MazF family toxin n=1 Tax=Vibrio europaeus TaxID=300876 RepID=A0A178JA47_9VIBR|nr:type II toxin-antitoxin system PemK/MazF family toxin [Vibrio europaeus]MDC5702974.1 type II toxin-antitoxin system PemK/MazF family toxin [Vibrio europaeus]MDC5708794.1 type II toxin-antitoxin system PemK/MazF family toxin [Vibrio europaeus]MDC5712866.1 type II toxin-antitoxin system PemK/MazF family toxin [Vibrio europaeus]MDC5725286.1 type II toxin-antitoxin system PemK/MazF family toxin [Vibrio europaeus]MDC5731850.1 type II toxin-antitoxin system PemK/MazF family toxin [Vibrio europaeu
MGLKYSPKVGQILMCNFNGFKEPEMVKDRPVLVIGTRPNGHRLATIVCLSTTEPDRIQPYHMQLDDNHLPRHRFFNKGTTWVKADMVYTLSLDRLSYVSLGSMNGKRQYFQNRLGRETMKEVYSSVLHGFNLGHLSDYL